MTSTATPIPGPTFGVAERRGWVRRVPLGVRIAAVVTALGSSIPLLYLAVRGSQAGVETWQRELFSAATLGLTARTVGLAVGVVALTNAIAIPAAWLVARTDLAGRRAWAVAAALPLALPSYVSAFVIVATFGPRGTVQHWLTDLGVGRLPDIAYGYSGALLALALFTYPYVFLPVVAALRRLDPAVEETARALGAGPWRVFRTVVLPQLRVPVLAGSLLVTLYTLSDFGAVSITRYDTFTLSIYNAYRTLFDRSAAATLALVLVVLTLLCLAADHRLSRKHRRSPRATSRRARRAALGQWKWLAWGFLGSLAALTLVTPAVVIVGWALRGATTSAAVRSLGAIAGDSFSVSTVTAVVAVALSIPVAYWPARDERRRALVVERAVTAGYALPGIVVALSLVMLATRAVPWLYQTVALLVFAYLVRFVPEAVASTRSGLALVPPSLEEAAQSLGEGPLATIRRVTLPLVRPSLAAGFGLVFLTTMKELPATLILRPTGFETLATRIWAAAGEGIYSQAGLPALALIGVSAPAMYFLVIRPALYERGSA